MKPQTSTGIVLPDWSAVRSALVADALRTHNRLRVRGEIHGESMLPTLWPGDVIEIESCSLQDISPGEIALARRDEHLILHRLVAPCTASGFLLRGDALPNTDPLFLPEALLGRAVCLADGKRRFLAASLRPGVGATCSRALGLLLRRMGIVRRVALKIHRLLKASAPKLQGHKCGCGPLSSGGDS